MNKFGEHRAPVHEVMTSHIFCSYALTICTLYYFNLSPLCVETFKYSFYEI